MTKVIDNTNLGYLKSKMDNTYWNKSDVVQIGIDTVPTANSGNLITSGAVETALEDVAYVGDEQGTVTYVDGVTPIDVSTKADKVSNATSGNFASLNSTGNLVDSGHKHSDYQAALVSGTNIKTINNQSLLGSGNITISGGSGGISDVTLGGTSVVSNGTAVLPAYPTTLPASDVSSWAKASTKPTYTASEVGALPSTTTIPTESTVSDWGFTKTDKQLQVDDVSLSTAASYNLIFSSGASTGTKSIDTKGLSYTIGSGTTFAPVTLELGNTNSADSRNNREGILKLYTKGGGYTEIKRSNSIGTNVSLELPTSSGTLALTSQLPSAVTESTVSGWGFTKNAGTITGVNMNGASKGTSGVVNLGTVVTSESDPVFTASAAYGISSTDISNWNAKQKAITVSSSEPTSSQGSNGDIWIVIWAE